MHYHHPNLHQMIEDWVSKCDTCQRQKFGSWGHSELAPQEAAIAPWHEVACNLIGPWTLPIGNDRLTFSALTVIDTVTNLTEVIRIQNKSSAHVALLFENNWLSRYPRPVKCIYDQGNEFIGFSFQHMLQRHGIAPRPTTVKNPQANSICERMHQTIGNTLRLMYSLHPPDGVQTAEQMVDTAIANAVFALRATVHSALQTTPGGLVFGRDMVLDIPLIADLQMIQDRRQEIINQRLIVANRKRFSYDYTIGDEVLKLTYKPNKLEPQATGRHCIE